MRRASSFRVSSPLPGSTHPIGLSTAFSARSAPAASLGSTATLSQRAALDARVPGQARAARAGEVLQVSSGTIATVTLRLDVPARDYLDRENRIDRVELVGISREGARVLFEGPPGVTRGLQRASEGAARGHCTQGTGKPHDARRQSPLLHQSGEVDHAALRSANARIALASPRRFLVVIRPPPHGLL